MTQGINVFHIKCVSFQRFIHTDAVRSATARDKYNKVFFFGASFTSLFLRITIVKWTISKNLLEHSKNHFTKSTSVGKNLGINQVVQ